MIILNNKSLLQDKPWVYAHLLEIQRRVGKENFPLIEQAFYPSHRDMVNIVYSFVRLYHIIRINVHPLKHPLT